MLSNVGMMLFNLSVALHISSMTLLIARAGAQVCIHDFENRLATIVSLDCQNGWKIKPMQVASLS